MTLAQRFAAANTSHDGHLTREQADAASWKYVSRNFAAIDKDHQGYVTVEDNRAYARANRAARHHTPKNSAPATTPVPEAPAAPAGGTGTSD